MDNTSLISIQGTTTIPKMYREGLGFKSGVRIYWYELEGLLIMSKKELDNLSDITAE